MHIKARPEDQGGVATAKSGGAAGQDSVDLADGLGVHSRTRRPAGLAQRCSPVIRQGEQHHKMCTFNPLAAVIRRLGDSGRHQAQPL